LNTANITKSKSNSNKELAICFLVINKINELPLLSINSCLENSNAPIYIGYTEEKHLENIPVHSRINRIRIEVPKNFQISKSESSYTGFDELAFFRLVTLKWTLFKLILNQGYKSLIYSDLDVLWFQNIDEILLSASQQLQEVDVFIQDQTLDIRNPKLCMGLVFFRNTENVMDLIRTCEFNHKSKVELREFIGDDDVVSDFYNENRQPKWISLLPQLVFPVGVNFNSYLRKGAFPGLRLEKPAIFHANFVIGERNKRLLMRMANKEILGKQGIGIYFRAILFLKRIKQTKRVLFAKKQNGPQSSK
jgi:Nucleotide-diphospho-sugar transferase